MLRTPTRIISFEIVQILIPHGAQVKGLIEGLITRLQEEAANDATHQGWCVEETHKAEKDRDYRLRELDREEAKTRKLQVRDPPPHYIIARIHVRSEVAIAFSDSPSLWPGSMPKAVD